MCKSFVKTVKNVRAPVVFLNRSAETQAESIKQITL